MWFVKCLIFLLLWRKLNCFNELWFSSDTLLLNFRDEFKLHNVTLFTPFYLNFNINKWKSINFNKFSYLFGLGKEKLVVVKIGTHKNTNQLEITFSINDKPNLLEDIYLIEKWTYNKLNVYAFSVEHDTLQIYILVENKLRPFWSWKFGDEIKNYVFGYDERNNADYLLTYNSDNVNIYQISLEEEPKIWLVHTRNAQQTTTAQFVSNRGKFYILLSKSNLLNVYEFKNNALFFLKTINISGISQIVTFKRNGNTYFAVAGVDGAVFHFRKGGMDQVKIINTNLEGIKTWLPVTFDHMRKEVLLFGQRNLEHGTHTSSVIETFTISRKGLEKYEDIPCSVYGESTNLLHCLTARNDFQLETSSYFASKNKLGLLVTNPNPIFLIEYENEVMENPLEKEIRLITEKQRSLQELMDQHMDDIMLLKKASPSEEQKKFNQPSSAAYSTDVTDFISRNSGDDFTGKIREYVDRFSALEKKLNLLENQESSGFFNSVIVNGNLEVLGEIKVNNVSSANIRGEVAEEVTNDIVRKGDLMSKPIKGVKSFVDLSMNQLNFENIFDLSSKELVFVNVDNTLNLTGVSFNNPVKIQEVEVQNINGVDFQKIPLVDNVLDELIFEKIIANSMNVKEINKLDLNSLAVNDDEHLESVFVPGNITVASINGENLNEIIGQICFKNLETYFPGKLHLDGHMESQSAGALYLNEANFPEEYVFVDDFQGVTILGKKEFKNSLRAKEVRTLGLVNGIKTKDLITLNTPQHLHGTTTFESLELSSKFELNGTVKGEEVKFLNNPILTESDLLRCNVNFDQLEVLGNIIVENDLNSHNLPSTLSNIIYEDDEITAITSIKEFPEGLFVRNNLTLTSNLINMIPVDEIVTKNTPQVIDVSVLNGNVNFEHLEIIKRFHDLNVTKLDQEVVKIEGEQFISSTLIFKDEIETFNFDIKEKWNEISVDDFYSSKGNRTFTTLNLNSLSAININTDNFIGNITNFNLKDFQKYNLNYNRQQEIDNMFITNSVINDLNCKNINDSPFKEYFDERYITSILINKVQTFEKNVKNLLVDGKLEIKYFNGKLLRDELNQERLLQKNIKIQGDVYFEDLKVNELSQNIFNYFAKNIVYKNTTDVDFQGLKNFNRGFTVIDLVEIDELNGVPKDNLLTKEGKQVISCPLVVEGDVIFSPNNTIINKINSYTLKELVDSLEYQDDLFIVKRDMLFERISYIKDFYVSFVNNVEAETFINNLVYTNGDEINVKDLELLEPVHISQDLNIKDTYNNKDLSEIVSNIVTISEESPIQNVIRFTQPVVITNELIIEEDLQCTLLNGTNFEKWKNDAIFINQGFLPGKYNIEEAEIHDNTIALFVNNINMNYTIPLKVIQNIEELNIDRAVLSKNIVVKGLVNRLFLPEEYNNTVLSNVEQEITSDLVFRNNTLVQGSIENVVIMNGHYMNKMVTTDKNHVLNSPFYFYSKNSARKNIHVDGFFNNINLTQWEQGVIKLKSKQTQNIEAPWHVANNLTFEDQIMGNNSIKHFDVVKVKDLVVKKHNLTTSLEHILLTDYKNICHDIKNISTKAKKQIYKFDTLENLQELYFNESVGMVHFFGDGNPKMVINYLNSCRSSIFEYVDGSFVHSFDVNVGQVEDMIHLKIKSELLFVIKNLKNTNCISQEKVVVWQYGREFKMVQNIPNQIKLQDSLIPSTFYGLNKQGVTEFKINLEDLIPVKAYRRWKIFKENCTFVPRGLGTGLALNDGKKLFKLIRNNTEVSNHFEEEVLRGEIKEIANRVLPEKENNKLTVMKVGPNKKTLLAVAYHENSIVETKWDIIKIYEDIYRGTIFHKLAAHKPSSLSSLSFENGETLLLVIEDGKKLQVYQYKGIEGFKHKMSANVNGEKMLHLKVPSNDIQKHVIAIIGKKSISFIKTVMLGNPVRDISC